MWLLQWAFDKQNDSSLRYLAYPFLAVQFFIGGVSCGGRIPGKDEKLRFRMLTYSIGECRLDNRHFGVGVLDVAWNAT